MNIAYVVQSIGLRFSEPGGPQSHIFEQLRALQRLGHTARLFALQGRKVLCTDDLEAVRRDCLAEEHFCRLGVTGARSYRLVESATRRVQRHTHFPYLALFDSHRLFDACCQSLRDFDIIHERYNLLGLAGAVAGRRLGIPYVLEVNADVGDESEFQGRPIRGARRVFAAWSTKFSLDTAHTVISVSDHLKRHLVKKWRVPAGKIVVLPNAADVEAFGQTFDVSLLKRRLGVSNKRVAVFVGGFYPWHDLALLVDSFRQVHDSMPDARLILVGDGPTRPLVERQIVDRGLKDVVIVAGAVDHSRVPEMLALADVAVAPNIAFFDGHGGSPLKLYEYMAAGKAIVATRTGQVAEVVRDGQTGLLVEPGDAGGFAQAIAGLLADPSKRCLLGDRARREARARHTWQGYAERLQAIYLNAIDGAL